MPEIAMCLNGGGMNRIDAESETLLPTLTSNGDAHSGFRDEHGLIAFDTTQITSKANRSNPRAGDPCHTLVAGGDPPCITLAIRGRGGESTLEARDDGTANAILTPNGGRGGIEVGAVAYPLLEVGARTGTSTDDPRAGIGIGDEDDPMFTLQSGKQHGVGTQMAVRRLTPTECERLQGFPDGYTVIAGRADGPRYRALGNSMAVPVMRWLLMRIKDGAL